MFGIGGEGQCNVQKVIIFKKYIVSYLPKEKEK